MAALPGRPALATTDLAALAANEYPIDIVRRLRAAESGKHAFLVEVLRRAVRHAARDTNAEVLGAAVAVLAEMQAIAPGVVEDVLALPHVGFWAADCVSRLRGDQSLPGDPASRLDLAHVAGFAAVAALRARYPFEIAVPVRDGTVVLPTMGRVLIGHDDTSRWARVRLDGDRATVTAGSSTVDIPTEPADRPRPHWIPVPRLLVHAQGLRLSVLLDASDPYLARLSPDTQGRRALDARVWQNRLQDAWDILVRHDRPAAGALAAALTTLVPLRVRAPDQPTSVSSGWAWGAIALSLPADALSLAEVLVHEFQHVVLSAVEDLTPLIDADDGQLYYAPWRDDPRPLRALLQGAYAYLGVSDFWYRLRQAGPSAQQLRSQVEFARRRESAFEATQTLAESLAFTESGRGFVTGMADRLSAWPTGGVSSQATAIAAELTLAHRLRWRLSHLRPDPVAVDTLAQAWIAGAPRRPAGPDPRSVLVPASNPLPNDLSGMLELRYRRHNRLPGRRRAPPAVGDVALLQGDNTRALLGYLARIAARGTPAREAPGRDAGQAWVGLILAWRRLAEQTSDRPILREPELFAAVFARVRTLVGTVGDGRALIAWLNREPP